MNFPSHLLGLPLLLLGWFTLALTTFVGWRMARRYPPKVSPNVFGVMIMAMALAWGVQAKIGNGPAVHLMLSPLASLLLGVPVALMAVAGSALVFALFYFIAEQDVASIGVGATLVGVMPIVWMFCWRSLLGRFAPKHLFVYLLGVGFFGAVGAVIVSGLTITSLRDALNPEYVTRSIYWVSIIPMAYAEAFMTGMWLTIAVIYRPNWVATFRDSVYLRR